MLRTDILFQDHMILQHGKKIKIWGTTDHREKVSVSIQNQTVEALPSGDGKWQVELEPLDISFEERLFVACNGETVEFTDVQVGDVWLAGGQSNMEFYMRYDADFESEKEVCRNSDIRFFDYPEVSYIGQIEEADYRRNFAVWRKAEPEQLEWFSAAGYYFAKEIQADQGIPIGILGCNWGGTPACAWMDADSIRRGGGEVFLDEYRRATENLDLEAYEKGFRNNPASWRVDPFADPVSDMLMRGMGIVEIIKKLYGTVPDLSQIDFSSMMPAAGPKNERRPAGLYESMLCQVAPYGIRGFLFYQGETDGDTHPECYKTLFPSLIECWRDLWKEELPFFFVQLAPFGRWMQCDGSTYSVIREAQQKASETVPDAGMAVITDVGMELDIHPKKKKPVGYRLALQAEKKVYGKDIICEAPTLVSGRLEDHKLTLFFENAGEGLYLAERSPDGAAFGTGVLSGIRLIQNGEEVDLSEVAARAEENTVILCGEALRKGEMSVIFGGGSWYRINLYNSADIPARPMKIQI